MSGQPDRKTVKAKLQYKAQAQLSLSLTPFFSGELWSINHIREHPRRRQGGPSSSYIQSLTEKLPLGTTSQRTWECPVQPGSHQSREPRIREIGTHVVKEPGDIRPAQVPL